MTYPSRLSSNLQDALHFAAKHEGFNPENAMPLIEEELTEKEYQLANEFLTWVHSNNKTYGWNLLEVYAEFHQQQSSQ
ncbi:hypothetical protein [Photobacterium lutimaris]|uniref:Uncharacterized protein n=1 Tax=Photobacterium lutimaris TaxID=388278 RepID=A0A2T3ITY0_9GAMM|nr:hypothetical protein [Photobacterium lutimaris]PSU31819.1 hypothetical protein C9I99_21785 [Photobacterium lutimaris]